MRDNITPDIQTTISAPTITTALCARLEFQSETIFVWTGVNAIQPTGSGDTLLDGHTFDPLAYGVAVEISENSFSYTGSEELTITLNIPAAPDTAIAAAQVYPAEYQSRPVTIWRALLFPQSNPLAQPIWLFRRIRSGAMDKVEVHGEGNSHTFALTIESHQSVITNATGQTYLDQKKYDATDTSQDYAVAIANGDPAPGKPTGQALFDLGAVGAWKAISGHVNSS